MKKIVLLAVFFFCMVSSVSAYQVYIYAPDTITVGMPLVVNGTTTFGIGTPIDVVLYQVVTTSTEVKRTIAYVQSDKSFRVVFDTTHLPTGLYKVEVPASGTGESISMRQVRLIDRSDAIVLSSPTNQALSGKMKISGKITGDENAGVQIAVIGPDDAVIYGPAYISTDSTGSFDVTIPVSHAGDYEVSFTDAQGYIGMRTISIVGGSETVTSVTITETTVVQASAHERTSRDDPAYFIVQPAGEGPVSVSTSTSVDWVVEYVDDAGELHTVNDQGEVTAEKIVVNGTADSLYFKVYPYKYTVNTIVYLYADNANSVSVSQTVPAVFAGSTVSPSETQKSPLPSAFSIIAACIVGLVLLLRRRK